jgi:hypothetical protein
MSSHGSIITEIMDLLELKNTLTQLELKYEEMKTISEESGVVAKVDVLIKDPNGREIGLQKTDKGTYRIIADCKGLTSEQLKVQQKFVNKIKQKYAYNKVVTELKKQGYIIAEEEKVANNTIKLVARKWG